MTIYEKIKTLSIYDMAEFLTEYPFGCEECEEGKRLSDSQLTKDERCNGKCKEYCLNWLNKTSISHEEII